MGDASLPREVKWDSGGALAAMHTGSCRTMSSRIRSVMWGTSDFHDGGGSSSSDTRGRVDGVFFRRLVMGWCGLGGPFVKRAYPRICDSSGPNSRFTTRRHRGITPVSPFFRLRMPFFTPRSRCSRRRGNVRVATFVGAAAVHAR